MEIAPKLNEYLPFLTESELVKLNNIKHPGKKLEFAATRYLRTQLFGKKEISYTTSGSPTLSDQLFISISHSNTHVAIGTCCDFEIGIDIEEIRLKAISLCDKFATEEECTLFNRNDAKHMSSLWSLKETLYKLSDRKELIFKRDIHIQKEGNTLKGTILKTDGTYSYPLQVSEFGNILITCNTSKGKKVQ